MKVPVPLFGVRPAYAERLSSKQSAYAKIRLCQLPVRAIRTYVHKSTLIAEQFCSIPVEGSTLCKHHKQLHQVSVYCVEF